MGKRFYGVVRDLHLYLGLFLSPFVVVFAVSVFYLVHSQVRSHGAPSDRVVANIPVTAECDRLKGRDLVNCVRPLLDLIGVGGEIHFIRRTPKEGRLVIPVLVPGRETTVELDLKRRTANISERNTGITGALIQLHRMPGPHVVDIRVNSLYMTMWRPLANVITYGVLFLTLSGLYLWTALRAERRVGMVLLCAGGMSFFGIIYAITQ